MRVLLDHNLPRVFLSDADRQYLLAARSQERTVRVAAYTLMSNHFHPVAIGNQAERVLQPRQSRQFRVTGQRARHRQLWLGPQRPPGPRQSAEPAVELLKSESYRTMLWLAANEAADAPYAGFPTRALGR